MIRLQNLTYSVLKNGEDVPVLDDITVEIPTDRAFGILGLERSGKTTLMRLLSGFTKPQSGEINRHARLSFPIGYEGIFKRNLSPRENLMRFGSTYGQQIDDIARYVNANTGLGPNFEVPLGKLPQELQSRFVFVATYALPFDCYLVDERFAPNELDFKATCQRMLEERAQGTGIILATRRSNILQRYCGSAGILDGGKLTVYERVEDAVLAFKDIEARTSASRLAPVMTARSLTPVEDSAPPARSERAKGRVEGRARSKLPRAALLETKSENA